MPSLNTTVRIGPYEVVTWLGAGGMGEVYRARDHRLERDVAIKLLPASAASDAARVRRFEQEARAARQLNHPNIVAIYDVGCRQARRTSCRSWSTVNRSARGKLGPPAAGEGDRFRASGGSIDDPRV